MAKPTGPLLSFDARGQIAKTQVYASWRGRQYVRRYTIPSNPKSSGQVQTRSVFAWLQNVWKLMSAEAQAPWIAAASGNALTDRNLFGKMNIPPLRTPDSNAAQVFSPGFGGMFPLTGVTAAGSPPSGQIILDFTAPALPSGWTFTDAVACAIQNQDPHTEALYATTTATAASSPITVTGLGASTLYNVGVWAKGTKPDGTVVYSPSVTITTATG